jgi:uncharacterized protein (DUF2267 family)
VASNLIDEVARRTGLERSAAAAAVQAVIEVLAAGLEPVTQGDLLAVLPGAGAQLAIARRPATIDDLYRRTAEALGMREAEALEAAQVVSQVIGARLSREVRARLALQLDPELVQIMTDPVSAAPAAPPLHPKGGTGHTLASGRPGSTRSLSASAPGSDHPLSEDGPGGERPLSESPSGSRRPLSSFRPK